MSTFISGFQCDFIINIQCFTVKIKCCTPSADVTSYMHSRYCNSGVVTCTCILYVSVFQVLWGFKQHVQDKSINHFLHIIQICSLELAWSPSLILWWNMLGVMFSDTVCSVSVNGSTLFGSMLNAQTSIVLFRNLFLQQVMWGNFLCVLNDWKSANGAFN